VQQDRTAILILIKKNKETKMKSMAKKHNGLRGFTIIELLTVMSIIILLMGLFMPAMTMVRRYARRVAQHNQLHSIEVGLAMFNAEWQEYPNATPLGIFNYPSGAHALAEAMVGYDLLGYDPDRTYSQADLSDRRPYLDAENANANKSDLYDPSNIASPPLDPNYVLSDVYPHVTHPISGRSFGMPVLYYQANVSNHFHSFSDAGNGESIYNYLDNHDFVEQLPIPGTSSIAKHAIVDNPEDTFYEDTRDYRTIVNSGGTPVVMPFRRTSYILLSAGFDGEFGTDDDVYNFSN
jgi:type II secretory pathway pseudopilin PulG